MYKKVYHSVFWFRAQTHNKKPDLEAWSKTYIQYLQQEKLCHEYLVPYKLRYRNILHISSYLWDYHGLEYFFVWLLKCTKKIQCLNITMEGALLGSSGFWLAPMQTPWSLLQMAAIRWTLLINLWHRNQCQGKLWKLNSLDVGFSSSKELYNVSQIEILEIRVESPKNELWKAGIGDSCQSFKYSYK